MRNIAYALLIVLLATQLWAKPIRVLATGDMHGWLQVQRVGEEYLGGAGEMLAHWRKAEGYRPERFLVLSGGDIATGPVLATALKGDPVVAVMNVMGYDASAAGNHEFDFGQEKLRAWAQVARFPFLAANLVNEDGSPTDLVAPYRLFDAEGVKVAVVGLTTSNLRTLTGGAGGLTVIPYADALRQAVPAARAEGAQAVIVLGHVTMGELTALAGQVTDLKIPLMLGGHSHEFGQMKVGDTWVVNNGEWWKGYSRIDLDYNPATGSTVVLNANQVWLQRATQRPDRAVTAEIAKWQQQLEAGYGTVLGYTTAGVARTPGIYNFVSDATLAADPLADIVVTNYGALRQDFTPGPITKGTIVGVMPFNNNLLRITLTGAQLLAYLPADGSIGMAGVRLKGGHYILTKTGQPIDPTATYRLTLNNYMYVTSPLLQQADPNPVESALDWRLPVEAWLEQHPTNAERPLEGMIDLGWRVMGE